MSEMDRTYEIREMLEEQVMSTGGASAWLNDAQYHAQIHQLADLLTMVDRAMEQEGVDKETRNRVVWTSVQGAPDREEAEKRMAQRPRSRLHNERRLQ